MKTTLDIQKRLAELGFDPGGIDGVRGRKTIAAVLHDSDHCLDELSASEIVARKRNRK